MKSSLKTKFYYIAQELKIKGDVAKLIDDNFRNRHIHYLDKCETVFAVSRLFSLVKPEKKLYAKLLEFNKKWLIHLVNSDESKELRPYIAKYGKKKMLEIINYVAADPRIWSSPSHKEALEHKSADFLKCLEVIDEAYNFLFNTEDAEVIEEIPVEEEPVHLIEFVDTPKDLVSPDRAKLAFDLVKEEIPVLKESFEILDRFMNQESLVDLYEEENEKLRNSITAAETKFNKLNSEHNNLKGLYDKTVSELESERNKKNELVDKEIGYTQKIERLEGKISDLEFELSVAKKAPKPSKIIPLSDLSSQPLVGKKLCMIMIDFLSKYNITVDPNK